MSLPTEPHPMDLYRFYDSDDRLLYIGISLSAARRASEHRADKPWWNDVAWMAVDHLGPVTRRRAEEIERHAIQAESPAHNIIHSGRPITPQRPAEPLGEVGEGVYQAWSHLLTTSSTYSPWTLEDLIAAVERGVATAMAEHLDALHPPETS